MGYFKFIFRLFVLVLLTEFHKSAPAYQLETFIQNCAFPKLISPSNSTQISKQFFLLHLHACLNISEKDAESIAFGLCHEINRLLSRICNQQIDDSMLVPYPEDENVCDGFAKLKTASLQSSSEPHFCKMMCQNNIELCQFLLWVYQVNSLLEGQKPLDNNVGHITRDSLTHPKMIVTISPTNTDKVQEINHPTVVDGSKAQLQTHNHTDNYSTTLQHTQKKETIKHSGTELFTSMPSADVKATLHATLEKFTNSKVAKTDVQQSNVKTPEISITTGKLQNNLIEKKTFMKVTKSYISSIAPSDQTNELSSSSSLKLGIEVTDKKDEDPSFIEEVQDYNTIVAGRTVGDFKSSKAFGDESQTETASSVKISSSGPGFLSDSIGDFDKNMPAFMESEDSHFFLYFLFIVVIVIGSYVLFHNKQKIIALIVEGRHERRRRPNGTSYKKLDMK